LKHIRFEYSNEGITLQIEKQILIEFFLVLEQYLLTQEKLIQSMKKNTIEHQTHEAPEEIGEDTNKMGIITDDPYLTIVQTFALSLFGCLHCVLFQPTSAVNSLEKEGTIFHYSALSWL
jgi:hypothetical protein